METKNYFLSLLSDNVPDAVAVLKGNSAYPDINGLVKFYALPESGVLIATEVSDLPDGVNEDAPAFFAFHLHENGDCSDDFSQTGTHYNPDNVPHPHHAGDFPPLISNDGYVWMVFYDSFLTLPMVLNRSVIIHQNPDDFSTQPSGNAGTKLACGIVTRTTRNMSNRSDNGNED